MPRPLRQVALALLILGVVPCGSAQGDVDAMAHAARRPQVMGFTDLSYLATGRDVLDGFVEGQMIGHVAAPLSERFAFFGEFSATAHPDGFSVEVERAILRYDFTDAFKLSAGRYHTPISYWNTAYHHGTWLHTTVARPEMVKFGGTYLPVHFVGVLVEGTVLSTSLGLQYAAGLGNGRGEILSRAGDAGDANGSRALLASLAVKPAALFGLTIGGGVYRDRVGLGAAGAEAVDETILSAFLAWEKERPEVLAEYAHVIHDPEAGGRTASDAGYAQLAYRLPAPLVALKPYARVERVDVPAGDALFGPLQLGYDAVIAGVRYDFAALAALKGEYRRERFEGVGHYQDSVYLQVSVAFGGAAF